MYIYLMVNLSFFVHILKEKLTCTTHSLEKGQQFNFNVIEDYSLKWHCSSLLNMRVGMTAERGEVI